MLYTTLISPPGFSAQELAVRRGAPVVHLDDVEAAEEAWKASLYFTDLRNKLVGTQVDTDAGCVATCERARSPGAREV